MCPDSPADGRVDGSADGGLPGSAGGGLRSPADGELRSPADGELRGPAGGEHPGSADGDLPGPAGRTLPGSADGRLLVGACWAVLILGLWLWGAGISGGSGSAGPATGDVAAAGRPAAVLLPAAHPPLAGPGPGAGAGAGSPQRIVIESAGVRAPVVRRGLDAYGAVDPPPYATPDVVGWYGGSARPGARGVALFVGHLDTESEPAVFRRLSAIRAGSPVRVVRGDGEVAEFTVESVEVFGRERFDARRVYGQHRPDRAELRLLTCGGRYDPATRSYSANVVVSAYLTGTGRA